MLCAVWQTRPKLDGATERECGVCDGLRHHADSCHKPVSIDKPVKSGYVKTVYIKLKCQTLESAAYLAEFVDLSECNNGIGLPLTMPNYC